MSEYLIREEQIKELADIVKDKIGLDIAETCLALIEGNRRSVIITSLPEGLTSIGDSAFSSCSNLALTYLPEGITSIGNSAFSSCSNLALTSLPEGITSIGNNAFFNCSKLTSLTFEGKPDSIDQKAFYYCNNLTTINVPWAEGAVAGAPWGATNATINYNYGV